MAIFKGAGVAIVTPMTADGEVNYEVLGEMLEASAAPPASPPPSAKKSIPQ